MFFQFFSSPGRQFPYSISMHEQKVRKSLDFKVQDRCVSRVIWNQRSLTFQRILQFFFFSTPHNRELTEDWTLSWLRHCDGFGTVVSLALRWLWHCGGFGTEMASALRWLRYWDGFSTVITIRLCHYSSLHPLRCISAYRRSVILWWGSFFSLMSTLCTMSHWFSVSNVVFCSGT